MLASNNPAFGGISGIHDESLYRDYRSRLLAARAACLSQWQAGRDCRSRNRPELGSDGKLLVTHGWYDVVIPHRT